MTVFYRAELYNRTRKGRVVGNGWRVVRFWNGGMSRETIHDWEGDEAAAREHAAYANSEREQGDPPDGYSDAENDGDGRL